MGIVCLTPTGQHMPAIGLVGLIAGLMIGYGIGKE
jgi:hypothetical protein